jgi:indolepyruvate ferredoxin oxidoreductase
MIGEYEADMAQALAGLTVANLETVVALASLPDKVRGYGPVKAGNMAKARAQRADLLARLAQPAFAVAAE